MIYVNKNMVEVMDGWCCNKTCRQAGRKAVVTYGKGQVRASNHGAALLSHLQRQRGCRVAPRPVVAGTQHRHLHHRGCHGDAVADRDGEGIVPAGEAAVAVQQHVPSDVAEGEGVT